MTEFFTRNEFGDAADFIKSHTRYKPTIGLILGSGLSSMADGVRKADVIPYDQIPHFPLSTVKGHTGRLIIGLLEERQVMVMQGRAHYYEGYSMQQVTLPIRVMRLLGINSLIVTNAAGGLNLAFQAGDLMLIEDHINLVGMAGFNPLRGPNDPSLGPRFPNMSQAYDPALRALARQVAAELGLKLHEGVYIMVAGPTFETPAELRFLRAIGVDAVGMSTVAEVIVAHHGGMRVLGVSGISNVPHVEHAEGRETIHEEVLKAGARIVPKLSALLKGVIRRMEDE
ncbi:MAG: purine-nucleoside phosphorylase [Anaerolineae bacterium]